MRKTTISLLFCLSSIFLFLSSKFPERTAMATPTIKYGIAQLTGTVTSPNFPKKDSISVNITVSHPISGEYAKYKALTDREGKFNIDVELETTSSLVSVTTTVNSEKTLLVKLTGGSTTNLVVSYNSDRDIEDIVSTPAMAKNDMLEGFNVISKAIDSKPTKARESFYNKSTTHYLDQIKNAIAERVAMVNNDTSISTELKKILSKDLRLWLYIAYVFPYEEEMIRNYKNITGDREGTPQIQKIDRTYFRFLKDLDLNNPQYLDCLTFQEFQKTILQNETLAIPEIEETSVATWIASVKTIMADLFGFKDGPYYDILAANAYAKQLTEQVRPLSEKQIQQISNYWKKGEIAKILFQKNKQVVELDKAKSDLVINDISSVADDKVIETITAKHKGKVVFIDLWATWCGPCLDAMHEFRSAKDELRAKEVAFVYLTNGSSPKKLWEEKIKGIGSEHYYLTASQWKYVMEQFEFEYIPSYLLFNKQGVLANKITAFPGSDKMKTIINGLL